MALGGVATGSMKASEAAMVQGNMTYSGWILMAVACVGKKNDNKSIYINLARQLGRSNFNPEISRPTESVFSRS